MKDRAFRTAWIVVAGALVVSVATVLIVRLGSDNRSAPVTQTATPSASTQLSWFVGATHHETFDEGDLRRHFAAVYLQAIGGVAGFEETFGPIGPLTLVSSQRTENPGGVSAIATTVDSGGTTTKYVAALSVNRAGLIDALHASVLRPSPTSWAAVDHRLGSLAPRVSFVTDTIDRHGRCHVVHGLDAGTPRPLGSAFKLYVLGALARDVADQQARWGQRLAIRNSWKSYPSGTLQNLPAGTTLTLREYADRMISLSDNTAADHLLYFVGRGKVERQLRLFGSAHASLDIPFPTTRELFTLKGIHYPHLADRYLAASPAERARILEQADRVPRSALTAWSQPRDVEKLEWFASPTDICHAYSGLLRESQNPRLAPVGQALSINDGGLLLNSRDYPVTWFKGGSEIGVLTENYLVKAADGTVIVTSVMLSDAHRFLDTDPLYPKVAAIVRGSLTLADPE